MRGHEVLVVAAWQPGEPAFERRNGVAVHRVAWKWTQNVRARVASARTARMQAVTRKRGWRALLQRAWRGVYWPDTSCTWLLPALRTARDLARGSPLDALVSVSPTFSAVVAGMRALAGLERRARWLIDLGDPFSFADEAPPNNFFLYRKLNRAVERSAFRRADAITVTTPETRTRYEALFPESAHKIEVIPPVTSVDADEPAPSTRDALSLVYMGTLYGDLRSPEFMMALFRRLYDRSGEGRLELHVYGDVQDCRPTFERYPELLERALYVHGTVPREQALSAMRAAAVLVNVGNRTTYQLPSKVVEYAALGKPILNLAAGVDDSSTRFLATYPRCLTLDARGASPSDEQVRRCEAFLEEARLERLPRVPPDWVAPYRVSAVSRQYLRLVGGNTAGDA